MCGRFRIIKGKEKDITDLRNELSSFAVYYDIAMDVVDIGLWKELVKNYVRFQERRTPVIRRKYSIDPAIYQCI